MKKKEYQKPSSSVIKLKQPTYLLQATSPAVYIPGMAPEEQNKLA